MGLRFRKSIKISKGTRINLSKSGVSFTVGTRGFHQTFHTSGRTTTSIGLPGTGLSYVATSGGGSRRNRRNTNLSASAAQTQNRQNAQYMQNCKMVDDYNELIDQIRSIHEECSRQVDWVAFRDAPEPFNAGCVGPNEKSAIRIANEEKPSFFNKLIPGAEKKREQKRLDFINIAKEKDRKVYQNWETLRNLAKMILNGNIDSYFYVISEVKPFDKILDFGSDFEVGTDNPNSIEVEFHAKTSKVVPNHVLSLTKTGKVSSKVMSKTMHYDIAQDYICSCILRIAREMFALLPVNCVVVHAVDKVTDAAGGENDDTVLSVLIYRNQIEKIDFRLIDPSNTIEIFKHNMNFKKTQGFKPVPRVSV